MLVLLFNVIILSYYYIWPLIDRSGLVESGEYRGLSIGDSKEDVVRITLNPVYNSKLKIVGYFDRTGQMELVFQKKEKESLFDSDLWVLNYPSVHKETVKTTFKENRLIRIEYKRNFFSP
ncbi:hypothetical protein AFK76_12215 [Idiomarina zobellii]|uniref:Uncharacterized protein n=2 Tax=Idiomarina zobellii TaxID=86103 RepID=A0A837NCS0_9GAMM|nr:hypothetical protein AFK76_12215 [Idiomarina zobellii]